MDMQFVSRPKGPDFQFLQPSLGVELVLDGLWCDPILRAFSPSFFDHVHHVARLQQNVFGFVFLEIAPANFDFWLVHFGY